MNRSPLLALLSVVLLAGCGADEPELVSEDQVPMRDTTVAPPARQPFTEVDRAGIEPYELVVELPWTGNRASKDPAEAAAATPLLGVSTLETEAFDRAVFRLGHLTAYPGYQVRQVPEGEAVECQGEGAYPTEAGPLLLVRLHPARAEGVTTGVSAVDQARLLEAGLACREGTALTWAARIDAVGEIRVLELEEPRRLVVDLR